MCSLLVGQAVEKTVEDIAEKQSPSQCVLPETSDSLKAFQTNPQKIEKLLQISPQRCCPTIAVSDRWLWKAKTLSELWHGQFSPFSSIHLLKLLIFQEFSNIFKLVFMFFHLFFMFFVSGTILCRFFSCRTTSRAPCEAPQRGVITWDSSSSSCIVIARLLRITTYKYDQTVKQIKYLREW